MIFFITVISILILILTFFKIEWGVGFFLLYFFLVPLYALYVFSFPIGLNLYYLILFLVTFFWAKANNNLKKYQVSLMIPFLFLFIAQAVLIPFHFSGMPATSQLDSFRIDLMSLLLPFVIITVGGYNRKNQSLFIYLLYVAIGISSVYTLFLLNRLGQNPYIEALTPFFASYENSGNNERVLEEGVRIFGYISSVYKYVTEYGVFLIFSSVFLLRQITFDKSLLPKILYGLVLICILVCGSRSVLMAESVVVLAFLLQQRRFKVLYAAVLFVVLLIVIVQTYFPDYIQFVLSIRDDTIAGGSSIEMRTSQLQGAIESIQNNPLFGNGYGWTGWYRGTIGRHPTMLSFESCLIQILCNNGILGLVIWFSFVFIFLRIQKKYIYTNKGLIQSIILLLVAYFSYTFFTGDYGTVRMLMVFYALIIINDQRCASNRLFSSIDVYKRSISNQHSIN